MQQDLFELVHENSSRSLNHALGLPSSSRGEHDVDRMVSWQLFELDLDISACAYKFIECNRGTKLLDPYISPKIRHQDDLLDRRDPIDNLRDTWQNVELAPFVEIPVSRKQNLWPQLAETIKDSVRAQLSPATSPDCSNARRRQHRNRGLHHIGQVARNSVTRTDSSLPKPPRQASYLLVQVRICQP